MAAHDAGDRGEESFQGLVLRHRGRTGLTQRQLASAVGVHMRSIQDWEAGVNYPSAERLRALVAAFLSAGGMTAGAEASEAEALWAMALREATRMQTPFDPRWFAELLTHRSGSVEPEVTPEQPPGRVHAAADEASEWRQDWGDAPDVISFLGRRGELEQLTNWMLHESARLVTLLGMGGIGKTMLAARVAQDVAPVFERVYWRSMRNAPPPEEWLGGSIGYLSDQQIVPPDGESARLAILLQLLRERRCLLVLDNMETLLEPGRSEGSYRDGFAGYGRLQRAVAEGRHQSCLLVTSREAAPELAILSGGQSVRVLELGGLDLREGQALLADKELSGEEGDWANLVARFGGNGLALKVVAQSIRQVFGGDIRAFFEASETGAVFGGIKRLLDHQVARSSPLEQHVLIRLAIEREPVTVAQLLGDLGATLGRAAILEGIEALRRRSLVERTQPGAAFTLQSVVLEYITDRLVEEVSGEVAHGRPDQLVRHPIIKATAKDYLRRTQEHLIGVPILRQLARDSDPGRMERLLLELLEGWRNREPAHQGFGPGNAINLLRLLRRDLCGLDLSGLRIRQAYLQEVEAQDSTLAGSELMETVLGGAFDAVNCVAASADGTLVAAGTLGGDVRVWQVGDRMPLLSVHGHTGSVGGVALSANGQIVASGGFDGTVGLWDTQSGRPLTTLRGHTSGVFDVALSADGQIVATCGEDGTVRLWDGDGRPLAVLQGHNGSVFCVALSADGRLIVSGGIDGTVRLWAPATGRPPTILQSHPGGVVRVAVSGDGRTVASCGLEGSVRLWDMQRAEPMTILHAHSGAVYSVALSADGRVVASCGFDGTVRLWEVTGGRPLATLKGHSGAIMSVALPSGGGTVVSGSLDGTVRVWEVEGGRTLATLQGYGSGIWGVAVSADARTLASGSFDGTVHVWDTERGRILATLRGHTGGVYGVALSTDARTVVSAGSDGTVRLWDTSFLSGGGDARLVATLHGHIGGVIDVAVSADGRTFASAGNDGTVRLWELDTQQLLVALQADAGAVFGVALSRDGRVLATGGVDGAVRLWEAPSGRPLASLAGHTGAVYGVSISADGQTLVSGGFDGTVRLWDAPSGRRSATLEGHVGAVYSVALSADGRTVASCGFDGTARLWEAASGRLLATLAGHTGAVRGMAFDEAGRTLASGSLDGTVKLWDTSSFSVRRTLRPDRRYERMDITDLRGVTEAQQTVLAALGAREQARV